MKKIAIILALALSLCCLTGCGEIDTGAILEQVETMASQVDVKSMVTRLVDSIDWEELKAAAAEGYDKLTAKYPALKQENIKAFLRDNGLKLMKELYESVDGTAKESARKLGEIIKILYPELTEDVDSVIG